jgi:WD40 repeat protein
LIIHWEYIMFLPIGLLLWIAASQSEQAAEAAHRVFYHQNGLILDAEFDTTRPLVAVVGRLEESLSMGVIKLYMRDTGERLCTWPIKRRAFAVRNGDARHVPFTVPREPYRTVAFCPTSKSLAVAGDSKTIEVFNITKTGRLAPAHHISGGIVRSLLASSDSGPGTMGLAFSVHGRELTAASSQRIEQYDLKTERSTVLRSGQIESVSASPDGRMFAVHTGDSEFELWDLAMRKRIGKAELPSAPGVIAISDEGSILAYSVSSNADGTGNLAKQQDIAIWDVRNQRVKRVLAGHGDEVLSLRFCRNGQTLVSGSYDRTIRFWNVADGQSRQIGPFDWEAVAVPDTSGEFCLAIVGPHELRCYEMICETPKLLWTDSWPAKRK